MFAALRGWAVGVSEQLRYDVVRRLAARLSEAFKASCVFALDADEDAQRRRRVARVALDVLRINRREERVEIARLRIVGCPGVATHRYRARRLRSAFHQPPLVGLVEINRPARTARSSSREAMALVRRRNDLRALPRSALARTDSRQRGQEPHAGDDRR